MFTEFFNVCSSCIYTCYVYAVVLFVDPVYFYIAMAFIYGVLAHNFHRNWSAEPLMQTAVGRTEELGSSPTLCRYGTECHACGRGWTEPSADRTVHRQPAIDS
jgi:hypothetical protein